MRLVWVLFMLCPFASDAKLFRNSYVSFELPDRWDCHMEGTEWVCSSQLKNNSREALIILTAKEAGPTDNLEAYESHLKKTKAAATSNGKPFHSVVKHIRKRMISNHYWVDSMHLGSEIPSYYTRYLATVKGRLAVLVTFSAHQRHYTKYSHDFFRAIESLKVVATPDLIKPPAMAPLHGGGGILGAPTGGTIEPSNMEAEDFPDEPEDSADGRTRVLAILVLVGTIGAYLFLRSRRKG